MKSKVMSTKPNGFGVSGGKGKMFGKQSAGPQLPGGTAHALKGDGGKFAKGGSGKMFGKQTAGSQVPGVTAHKTKGR